MFFFIIQTNIYLTYGKVLILSVQLQNTDPVNTQTVLNPQVIASQEPNVPYQVLIHTYFGMAISPLWSVKYLRLPGLYA